MDHLSPAQVSNMVQVNLTAPLTLTSLCLPYIKQSVCGAIVMVGSLAGRAPLQGAAVYAATKAGLRSFAMPFMMSWLMRAVKVAIVSPGPIDTGFIMDEIDRVEDIVYSQPMSSAQAVAKAIAELTQANTQVEKAMPALSGKLTTIGYLFPKFRRWSRPFYIK